MDTYTKRQIALGVFTAIIIILMHIHSINLEKEKQAAARISASRPAQQTLPSTRP